MELFNTLKNLNARFGDVKSTYKAKKNEHNLKVLQAAQKAFETIQTEKRDYQPKGLKEKILKPFAFICLSIALRINLAAVSLSLRRFRSLKSI